jgi:hypothetical protein
MREITNLFEYFRMEAPSEAIQYDVKAQTIRRQSTDNTTAKHGQYDGKGQRKYCLRVEILLCFSLNYDMFSQKFMRKQTFMTHFCTFWV